MSLFSKKMKHVIVMLLVFAMMLQVVGPTVYAYADSDDSEDFKITITDFVDFQEDGTATAVADWKFDYNSSRVKDEYLIEDLPFWLDETVTGDIASDDDVFIGTFTAEGSQITVELSKKFKEAYAPEEVPSGLPSEENSDEENLGTDDTPDGVGTPTPDDNKTPGDDGTLDEGGTSTPDDKTLGGGQAPEEGNQPGEDDSQQADPEDKLGDETDPTETKEDGTPSTDSESKDEPAATPETETESTSEISQAIRKAITFIASADDSMFGTVVTQEFTGSFKIEGVIVPSATATFAVGPQKDLGNIFTFESMKIGESTINDGDVIEISDGTTAQVKYRWDTNNLNAQPNDTASIELPDVFKDVTISADIVVDGTKVGTYSIYDGVLTFVFNENITQDNVKNGFVDLGLEFDLKKFESNIVQKIPFKDGNQQNITVTAKPSGIETKIVKEGKADANMDAKSITWTVKVINGSNDTIKNAEVSDNVPAGLGQPKNFVIRKLNIGINGSTTPGETVFQDKQDFPINLEDMAPYTGYIIEYTTDITDYTQKSFTNNAEFKHDEGTLPAGGTVSNLDRSNPITKDGSPVGNDGNISWSIDVNKNGQMIPNAIVDDTLPTELSLNGNITVVKITKSGENWIEGSAHTASPFSGFPITLGALTENDAYRIKFNTATDWSKVNSGEYKKANGFNNTATLYNGSTAEANKVNDAEKTVSINRNPILQKIGVNKVDYTNKTIEWEIKVNEAKHPFTQLTVTDLIPKGLELVQVDGKAVTITKADKSSYTNFTESSSTVGEEGVDKGKTKLEITLSDVGNETLSIKYTTKITDFTINSFTNSVGMSGNGVGTDYGSTEANRNVQINPTANSYNKSKGDIDYNEKTMGWELTVDPKREGFRTGFKITDTFPNAGLILLPNTVKVKLGSSKLTGTGDNPDYTLVPISGDYKNGFEITFNIPIENAVLEVTYDTSYDPELAGPHNKPNNDTEKNIYRNQAEFSGTTENSNPITVNRDALHKVRKESWNSGKKEGQLISVDGDNVVNEDGWDSGHERKIAWQLYTNFQKQNLGKDVSVTDTLGYNGVIEKDSIKVSVYTVDNFGETTITDTTLTKGVDYTVNEGDDNNNTFTLTFSSTKDVNERYVIEYITSVPEKSAGVYTNNAEVTVNGTPYPYIGSVQYSKHDKFLKKETVGISGNQVFTDDEINWKVTVNESLSIIHNAVITDTINAGHVYKNGSLKVYKSQETSTPLIEGTDYILNDDVDNVLKITLPEDVPLKDTLVLEYITVVTTKSSTNTSVGNTIEIEGFDLTVTPVVHSSLNARLFANVGGEWATNKGALKVTKMDAEEDKVIDNNEATFRLWYDLNGTEVEYIQYDQHNDAIPFRTVAGVLEIGNLPLKTYYLEEVSAPTGYVKSTEKLGIIVDKPIGNKDNPVVTIETFENTKEKIEITGVKVWEGGPTPNITLQLFRGEDLIDEQVLTGKETPISWRYTWTLPKTDIDGNEYTYTVREKEVLENYSSSVKVEEDGVFKITNTYTSPKIDVTVNKIWVNGPTPRPSINLQLIRNNVPLGGKITLADGEETYTWYNLDETDEDGVKYEYRVDEDNVENYGKSISKSEDGLTITLTNTYGSPKTDIVGGKTWINGSADRPIIELQLYRNGIKHGSPVELKDGALSYIWKNLDKTDSKGSRYSYTVDEVNVPENYEKTVDGMTVTNTYVIPKTDIKGTKVWTGGGSRTKPGVELQLYRDGEKFGDPVKLDGNEEEPWTYTWDNLDETDIDGNEYKYTIDEISVPRGYRKSISEDGLTITNRYVPPYEPGPERPTDPDKPEEPDTETPEPGTPEPGTPEPGTPGPGPEGPGSETPGPEGPGSETPGPETPGPGPETPGPERPPVEETTEPEKPVEVTPPNVPEGSVPEVKEPPKNGTVTFDENGKWIYTPNPGFTGEDTFIITITHPNGTTEDILITVNVTPPKGNVLPKTGEFNHPIVFYIAGVMMIGLGVILRRKTVKS